ncbi:MAG: hypothetical protein LBD16_06365 [Oscillospiraceae bacterium]|nr:hypothetical protein [Oscillospiraceae bacterium]
MEFLPLIIIAITIFLALSGGKKKAAEQKNAKQTTLNVAKPAVPAHTYPPREQSKPLSLGKRIYNVLESMEDVDDTASFMKALEAAKKKNSPPKRAAMSSRLTSAPTSQPPRQEMHSSLISGSMPDYGEEGESESVHREHEQSTAQYYAESAEAESLELSFEPDDIINGVIYSEILGKPKSRRVMARA